MLILHLLLATFVVDAAFSDQSGSLAPYMSQMVQMHEQHQQQQQQQQRQQPSQYQQMGRMMQQQQQQQQQQRQQRPAQFLQQPPPQPQSQYRQQQQHLQPQRHGQQHVRQPQQYVQQQHPQLHQSRPQPQPRPQYPQQQPSQAQFAQPQPQPQFSLQQQQRRVLPSQQPMQNHALPQQASSLTMPVGQQLPPTVNMQSDAGPMRMPNGHLSIMLVDPLGKPVGQARPMTLPNGEFYYPPTQPIGSQQPVASHSPSQPISPEYQNPDGLSIIVVDDNGIPKGYVKPEDTMIVGPDTPLAGLPPPVNVPQPQFQPPQPQFQPPRPSINGLPTAVNQLPQSPANPAVVANPAQGQLPPGRVNADLFHPINSVRQSGLPTPVSYDGTQNHLGLFASLPQAQIRQLGIELPVIAEAFFYNKPFGTDLTPAGPSFTANNMFSAEKLLQNVGPVLLRYLGTQPGAAVNLGQAPVYQGYGLGRF